MASVAVPTSTRTRTFTIRTTLLVVLAVGQLVGPAFVAAYGGAFTTADRAGEPPIVPAGYAFSLWSVITALSLGYAVWSQWSRRTEPALVDRLATPLLVVFAGFSLWLAAAEIEPTWSTVVVFAIMLGGLLVAVRRARQDRAAIAAWPVLGRVLLWTMLGLYTGWSSAAIWVNLTTALAGSGAPITGSAAVAGQLAILAGATATAVLILRWTGGLLPYALAVVWALLAVIVGAWAAGEPTLAIAAALGTLVVAAAWGWQQRHGFRPAPGTGPDRLT